MSRAAVRDWLATPERVVKSTRCLVCGDQLSSDPESYAYLLGQYLGDGHLATLIRVPRLRVTCADTYPGIAAEVDAAMTAVTGNKTGAVAKIGCADHYCYSMHWPCLFPQHGPGRKHERPIVLEPWQNELVQAHPWALIRGLIHSDGCRATNNVVVRGKRYSYPRYFMSKESRDILAITGDALDQVGVEWRYNRPNSISVAKCASVALMEAHIGPKH